MAARRAPQGGAGGGADERRGIDRPGGNFHRMMDPGDGLQHLRRKRLDVSSGKPWRAQPRGDVRRPQILGLHPPQRRHIAQVAGIAFGGSARLRQFGADSA